MLGALLGLDMPEPVSEGGVLIKWERSSADPRKIKTTIILDFGKTTLAPEKAGLLICRIAQMLRYPMKVKLDRISRP